MGKLEQIIGSRIEKIRTDRKLSREKVASGVAMDPVTLYRIERNKQGITLESIEALADYFEVPPAAFFTDDAVHIQPTPEEALEIVSALVRKAIGQEHGRNKHKSGGEVSGEESDKKEEDSRVRTARKRGRKGSEEQHDAENARVEEELVHTPISATSHAELMAQAKAPVPTSPEEAELQNIIRRCTPDELEMILNAAEAIVPAVKPSRISKGKDTA